MSKHWADADGGVNWLLPDGEVRRARPESFGVIGNGHFIKMGAAGEPTPWDQNYESEFQAADGHFPGVISWLDGLDRVGPPFEAPRSSRIIPQTISDAQMGILVECLVSMAVRSPMHRARAVALAEDIRGPLPERERNRLIGANMRNSQKDAVQRIGSRGKVMVIFSPEREFIFGDGFFHNITPQARHMLSPKMLVPITPWLAVLFAQPRSYRVDPKLVTLTVNSTETDALNRAVQVYACNQIFYRSEKPGAIDAYKQAKHLVFADHRNCVDELIHQMPGIPPRDTALDDLLEQFRA